MKDYSTCVFPDREAGKDDARVRIRVRYRGKNIAFLVGYRVNPDKWDRTAQRCKRNTNHGKAEIPAAKINREIERYLDAIESAFENLTPSASPDAIRAEVNKLIGRTTDNQQQAHDVYKLLDEFVSHQGKLNNWSDASYTKFNALRNHLLAFDKNLHINDFTTDRLSDFVESLRITSDLRNATIAKQLSFLKWFLRWAKRNKYLNVDDFETFAPKLKSSEKKVIFLEWDELMRVESAELPTLHLRQVRDVFCFCCFTSLRYSDVANLKWSNVFDDYISITTIKTNDSLNIDLNDHSRAILNRYRNADLPDGRCLPVISNQKMNAALKDVMRLCDIDTPTTIVYYKGNKRIEEVHPKYELIGTHCGRRTFICNALMLGIPPEIVMKWTGHADYSSMKPYIAIADSAKKQAMSLFNK
ncbi:MAG: phage integrase SAM-like domain-containing protein [Bacteroidales bacterium]|nr:phage integrase SAM-like domain-containing protein [Bacteroidales bacterium]